MRAVFILCDTINRRMLDIYNKERQNTAQMPNLNRLAKKGVVIRLERRQSSVWRPEKNL